MLKKEGVKDDAFISMILKWRCISGFNVDSSVRIARDDQAGLTALAHYIIRGSFSTAKLTYNSGTAMLVYRSKMTHGKNKRNLSIITAEEFIAAITQHIPEKSVQPVRCHGWYSSRMRGDPRNLQYY